MIWGCHSFEGGRIHAIFTMYYSQKLYARLYVIWQALTKPGIIGYVYATNTGNKSKSIENEIEKMGNYGIVHGKLNFETHNYK